MGEVRSIAMIAEWAASPATRIRHPRHVYLSLRYLHEDSVLCNKQGEGTTKEKKKILWRFRQ